MTLLIVTFLLLCWVAFFQVRNYIKYRDDNAANTKRALLVLMMLCNAIHCIRLILGFTEGYFLTGAAVCMLLLYTDWLDWIREKRKPKGP